MLLYKTKDNEYKTIYKLLVDTALINVSNKSLKDLIASVASLPLANVVDYEHVAAVLNLITSTQAESNHRACFVFGGDSYSGLGISSRRDLPKEGYCFFGWIRSDRHDQTTSLSTTEPMCIFKLGAAVEHELELTIIQGTLHYWVLSPLYLILGP